MQNLTAHYNIIFNANELLRQKQENYAFAFTDNYNQPLNVYQDTIAKSNTPDKDLDLVIQKANSIIDIKDQSRYVGDAYMLLAKANFLGGNYFNAVEYCNYVIRTYPEDKELLQQARVWKARALIYLNKLPEAKLTLDTALHNIDPKHTANADVYATRLQYDLSSQNYPEGEEMAKKAIFYSRSTQQQLRWTFILGQLQELNHRPADAIDNYSRVVKSNVAFEMAFNANLNRIRLQESEGGRKVSRIDRLRELIKNPNNKDFIDQIYYQIAELYFGNNDLDNAIKNYNLSIRYSKKNPNQKGLAYLRLAEINFNQRANYVRAKNYYDSTLNSLSPVYPEYKQIQKKSNNLQLLVERFRIISNEDTLQMLARLDEKTRLARIDAIVKRQLSEQKNATPAATTDLFAADPNDPIASVPNGSNFYFYNPNAVSQGYTDFKRQWGNRKLEDNWRRSSRSNADMTINTLNTAKNVDVNALPRQQVRTAEAITLENNRQELLQNIPRTPAQLAQSNTRIYDAYFDAGNYYRDMLDDKKEAINIYELMLGRFPNNPNTPAVYYNLYRLYAETNNNPKSEHYKGILLKDYPATTFAQVIKDPNYAKKLNDENAQFNDFYNQVYELFSRKQYTDVIKEVEKLLQQYPENKFSAQLYYLKTIAGGHQQALPPFKSDLEKLAGKYPKDKLITPLVNQHLDYINKHQKEMSARHYALVDNDPNEIPFIPKPIVHNTTDSQKIVDIHNNKITDINKLNINRTLITKVNKTSVHDHVIKSPAKNKTEAVTFSMRDTSNYYFVIDVSTGSANLASSRFGIGQFNRANFQDNNIKHQLLNVGDDNQLIYVGRFYSLKAVKDYARAIIPLMPEIMKVPKDKYSFFIITQENLDKLADKKLLDSYISYYQKNY